MVIIRLRKAIRSWNGRVYHKRYIQTDENKDFVDFPHGNNRQMIFNILEKAHLKQINIADFFSDSVISEWEAEVPDDTIKIIHFLSTTTEKKVVDTEDFKYLSRHTLEEFNDYFMPKVLALSMVWGKWTPKN